MKDYLVFEWDRYYPSGGWDDLKQQFDTFTEVEAYHHANPLEWAQSRQVVSPAGFVVVTWHGEGY
jgi:hypothetical protein